MKKVTQFTPGMYRCFCADLETQLKCCSDICTKLSESNIAYFAAGWENDIYCKFAHRTAKEFGILIQYELEEKPEYFQCTLDELVKSSPGGSVNG